MKDFQSAKGSIVGVNHIGSGLLLKGRNNQDAVVLHDAPDLLVAVVTDGCSKSKQSEVGAWLGAAMLSSIIIRRLRRQPTFTETSATQFWEHVRQDLLAQLRVTALSMAGEESLTDIIDRYFLFSIVALVMTPQTTQIVCSGDGMYAVNGEVTAVEPYPGNLPPYVAYDLINSVFNDKRELLRFQLLKFIPTGEVNNLLIGTDGVSAIEKLSQRYLPGKLQQLGPLSQFWSEDRYFNNSDAVRRTLALANSSGMRTVGTGSVLENGLLSDDTTLVAVRRRT